MNTLEYNSEYTDIEQCEYCHHYTQTAVFNRIDNMCGDCSDYCRNTDRFIGE